MPVDTYSASDVEEAPSYSASDVEEAPTTPPTLGARRGTSSSVPEVPQIHPYDWKRAAVGTLFDVATGAGMPENMANPPVGATAVEGARELGTPGKRASGAAKLVGATGEALSPLMGPAALENPVPVATGLLTGAVASKGAKAVTKAAGGGPGAQDLAEQAGWWAPVLAGTALGYKGGVETTPEGTRGAATILGGKAGIGAAVTPEAVAFRGKVGPFEGQVSIPRGPQPAGPALEPPTIEGQPITRAEASEYLERTNYDPDAARALAAKERSAKPATQTPTAPPIAQPTPSIAQVPAQTGGLPAAPSPSGPSAGAVSGGGTAPAAKIDFKAEEVEEAKPGAIVKKPAAVQGEILPPKSTPKAGRGEMPWSPTGNLGLGPQTIKGEVLPPSTPLPKTRIEKIKDELRGQYPGNSEQQLDKAAREQLAFEEKRPPVTKPQQLATSDEVSKQPTQPAVEPTQKAEEPKYKFGSTQANIPVDSEAAKALSQARDRIPESDLAGKGKESEPHVTVKYGIQGEDTEGIRKHIASLEPFEASLGKTDVFPPSEHSDGAAVVMAPIEAPELHEINSKLGEHGDFTKSDFEYKPHATISYVKPEVADRYKGMNLTAGKKFPVNEIAITDRNGKQTLVKLEGKKGGAEVAPPKPPSTPVEFKAEEVEEAPTKPKRITKEETEAKPWEYNASQYQMAHGVHAPHIGEISTVQFAGLSGRGKNQYEAKRRAEWDASAAIKSEWRDRVVAAHERGEITKDTHGISDEAKSAIFHGVRAKEEKAQNAALDKASQDNRITDINDVAVGDRVFDVLLGRYGTVEKKFKASVQFKDDKGNTHTALARRLQWKKYDDLNAAVKAGESIKPTPKPVAAEKTEETKPRREVISTAKAEHVGKEQINGSLFGGETGTFTPAALHPGVLKRAYASKVENFLGKHKLGDKYFEVAKYDPQIADQLHRLDNIPRYGKDKGASNIAQVTKGLNEDQVRLASLLVDSRSHDYLRDSKPEEYQKAITDPQVMTAVEKFRPLQDQMTADRLTLNWPVRKSMSVEDNSTEEEKSFLVRDRDGNEVQEFKTKQEALDYVDENAEVEPHLKALYPEHTRNPLPFETGPSPYVGTYNPDRGVRQAKADKASRTASGEYHYLHATKDFSGYIKSFAETQEGLLKKEIFDTLAKNGTEWTAGTAQPTTIKYLGKEYTRPDVALKAKKGGADIPQYTAYDPTRGEKFVSSADRYLVPRQVADALERYDASRGGEGAGTLRKFFQEQIVGLYGPTVHIFNIVRRLSQVTGMGTFDPRSWNTLRKLVFSKDLRERAMAGVDDATVDYLMRYGHYTDWRDIGNVKAYIGGNLNPFNWVRTFGKGVLFDPKFAGGWGGLDPKARILAADFVKDHVPGITDEQIGQAADAALGMYNKANWTERQKFIARFTLFPGWSFGSVSWFLRHPFISGVAPALVVLAANLIMHKLGKNKDDDQWDMSYLHYGDRKYKTGLVSDAMATHLAQPVVSGIQAKLQDDNVGSAVGAGVIRGAAGVVGELMPPIQTAASIIFNRQFAGGDTEISQPADKYIPGTWLPNRDLEKKALFAVVKTFPAINRFLDPKNNPDWKQGVGSMLGVTNYKSGAEERLKANVAKSMGYSQTLSTLAEREPEAAQKFVEDPNKAVYLLFHGDLDEISKDLKDLDKETERVKMAGDLSQKDRKETLKSMEETRKQILLSAEALSDALTDAKLQMKKAQ